MNPDRSWGALAAEHPHARPLPRWWAIDMWRMTPKLPEIDRDIAKFANIEVNR